MKENIEALDDFPADAASCANCTRKAGLCPRRNKSKYPHGYLHNYFTGEISGVIMKCANYTGKYMKKPMQLDINFSEKSS